MSELQISEAQRANLEPLLDVLIPASGDFAAAGALGVAKFIDARIADTKGFAKTAHAVLSRIDALVNDAKAGSLASLPNADRVTLVRQVEASDPLTFLAFLMQVYLGYYTNPAIPPKLGFPDRPPQPLGHTLPVDDNLEELLGPVRRRGRHYRQC